MIHVHFWLTIKLIAMEILKRLVLWKFDKWQNLNLKNSVFLLCLSNSLRGCKYCKYIVCFSTLKSYKLRFSAQIFGMRSKYPTLILFQPRKALLEQLSRIMPVDEAILPDHVILVPEGAANLAARLVERQQRVLSVAGPADVRATMTCLMSKLQKL